MQLLGLALNGLGVLGLIIFDPFRSNPKTRRPEYDNSNFKYWARKISLGVLILGFLLQIIGLMD